LNGASHHPQPAALTPAPSNGAGAGNNGRTANPPSRSSRPATSAQVKAIYAIARSRGLDLRLLLEERYQAGKPNELSVQEASRLIDELKQTAPAREEGG